VDLFGKVVTRYLKLRIGKIRAYLDHPVEVQEALLKELIQSASSTEIGKQYSFGQMAGSSAFRSTMPVVTYEQFKPWLSRVVNGEVNVIWPSDIRWLAKSSGTTGDKSKFIPVSKESLKTCHYRGPRDLVCMFAHNNPDTRIFHGKSLIMGGSQKIDKQNPKVRSGDISAIMTQNQPALASLLRSPGRSIALMEDWEEKIERMAQKTASQNISSIGGVPTWTLVLIRRILEITGKDHLGDVWPNLELYMHGGVNFEPYRKIFRSLMPLENLKYYQIYNASEGFFAFQIENDADDMLLALNNGIYYEFIPQGHFDDDNPPTRSLAEVETGKNYAIVISTNSGLWRYKVGDTIQFTSLFPFRIKVTGRTKHFINAFGEEVIIDNAEFAIQKACEATGAEVREYTVAPVYFQQGEKAAHEWLIEFDSVPGDTDQFVTQLDRALQQANSDYEAKRTKGMALKMPLLTIARRNLFYDWLKQKNKLGGQFKIPRLSNNRELMEELKLLI